METLGGADVMINLAVGGPGEFQVRDVVRKEGEHAKPLDRGRNLIHEGVAGVAGGAIRVFLCLAAVARLNRHATLGGVDF